MVDHLQCVPLRYPIRVKIAQSGVGQGNQDSITNPNADVPCTAMGESPVKERAALQRHLLPEFAFTQFACHGRTWSRSCPHRLTSREV